MMFHNKLPLTDAMLEWQASELPPDQWYFDKPVDGHAERSWFALPDDLEQRWNFLLAWMLYESYWDQCIRQPQVSHREYQFIVDYLQDTLARECGFVVPRELSCFDFPMELEHCSWDHTWSRYPAELVKQFQQAGIKLNPAHPLDDERHPLYNEYTGLRNHIREVEERRRPKDIQRITSSDLPKGVVLEEEG